MEVLDVSVPVRVMTNKIRVNLVVEGDDLFEEIITNE